MAALLKRVISSVWTAANGDSSPYTVKEGKPDKLSKLRVITRDQNFTLYKDANVCDMVLYNRQCGSKYFSLFRLPDEMEAVRLFQILSIKIQPLLLASNAIYDRNKLQKICDSILSNSTWTAAHIAAHVGLPEVFKLNLVAEEVNVRAGDLNVTPLHVAILEGQEQCVKELLIMRVDLLHADANGDTVFHYAAKSSNPATIRLLACKHQPAVNQMNNDGEGPLHIAALSDKPSLVESLLMHGADPCITRSNRFPIHCAMKVNSLRVVEVLCRFKSQIVLAQDGKHGGTPMHWAKTRKAIELLCQLGCPVDCPNSDGATALHVMIKRGRIDCMVELLSRDANPSIQDAHGNAALHLAIKTDNIDVVRTLVVFGADVNQANKENQSPRHLAATDTGTNRDINLYTLHMVGAQRCPSSMRGCNNGCSSSGTFNGRPQGVPIEFTDINKHFYDEMIAVAAVAALARRGYSSSSASDKAMDVVDNAMPSNAGYRVLCLDGGGIKGLVLTTMLNAIEKAAGRPIKELFDWISGTSTGAILALAIVHGKSIQHVQGLYFRMKDDVFIGSRPYDSEPLEKAMKIEFGEKTIMTAVQNPKVCVTGVLGDRLPAELHLFRNYDKPPSTLKTPTTISGKKKQFKPTSTPHEQLVWRAARCSGAAPTYFRACGRFLDGGLIANNPTLDTLTEIHEYNAGLKELRQDHLVHPVSIVVSLGTGLNPVKEVNHVDVFKPEGLIDAVRIGFGVSALGNLIVDQVTQSDGRVVDRARAWCSMVNVPYFRINPQFSEDIPLDCNNDSKLVRMMWETQCYIYQKQEQILQIAQLLTSGR